MDLTTQSDGELAKAFAMEGANEPFAELIRRHGAMVFRTCRRVTGNHQDAEDAMQLVFAAVAEKATTLGGYRSLGGWLYSAAWRISRHVHRSKVASHRRELRAAQPHAIHSAEPHDERPLLELYRALEMLPPDYRDAIVLHHLEGLTLEQVADIMTCSQGTTASRISRGRAMVRERLRERGVTMYLSALEGVLLTELTRQSIIPAVKIPSLPAQQAVKVAAPMAATNAAMIGWTAAIRVAAACIVLCGVSAGSVYYQSIAGPSRADRTPIHGSGSASVVATSLFAGKESEMNEITKASTLDEGRIAVVPEPSTISLLGLTAVGFCMRRRKSTIAAKKT